MYSALYTSAPTIPLFIIPLFTIQEWTSFTPGRVVLCIVGIMAVLSSLSSLLYNNLLYRNGLYISPLLIKSSWQGYITYSGYYILVLIIQLFTVQEYVIQKRVIFTPGRVYNCIVYII